jgi:peptidoglycan/xylan/chitin deacetylase (PgdA/CDA1 family)
LSAGGATRPAAWGPEQRGAAVAVTFDNLGEASALERRQWPDDEPLGRHFSVTRALPRVLDLLAELELNATFFVEGINAQLYPEALQEIDAAGHEVAYHGWRHEPWADLDPSRERELLQRGNHALAELGLAPVGFRPPGGRLTPTSPDALRGAGFTYCSPAGAGAAVRHGLAVLPFRWTLIDAFHYLPNFADRRRAAAGASDPLPPATLTATLHDALERTAAEGGFLATLFHPFLADTEERLHAMRAVLTDIRQRAAEGTVWCAPVQDLAAWMLEQPDTAGWGLRLDED